jgi:hypothetical protein
VVTVQWLERDSKTRTVIAKPGDYGRPSLSPDGRRLAIEVREGSSQDIWVYDWARDTMTRVTFDDRIMVASYTVQGDSFVPDKPRLWSEKVLANLVNVSKNVDLAPAGTRFAAVMPAEGSVQQAQHHVVFLENFFDELKRRVH